MTTTELTPPDHHVLDNMPRTFVLHLLLAARAQGLATDVGMAALLGGATYGIHTALDPHPLWAPVCALLLAAMVLVAAGRVVGTALERTRSSGRWWGLMRTVVHPCTGVASVMDTDERTALADGPWVLIQPLHTNEPCAVWVPVHQTTTQEES